MFGFIAKHRGIWPVSWMCGALGVSRSGFHAWLTRPPSGHYLLRARKVLSELANRNVGPGSEVDLKALDEIGAFCEGVAKAAGGLFGIGTVGRDERQAIEEIVSALGVERSASWKDLKQEFR